MSTKKRRRIVDIKMLPGQPTDGSGKVCIHLFVPDGTGPIVERSVTQLVSAPQGEGGGRRLSVGSAKGHIACDRKRLVAPRERGGVVSVTMRTIEPGAVTCPACIASKDYARIMKVLNGPGPEVAAPQEAGTGGE